MPVLDHVKVSGFKSIKMADLKLSPGVNVLIGPNGSGKSNFISFFRLINHMGQSKLQEFVGESGGADSLFYYGRKVTQSINLELKFGANAYTAQLVPTEQDQLFFADESCYYSGHGYDHPYVASLGAGHFETALMGEMKRHSGPSIASHVYDSIVSWQVYHFHDTSSSARVKQTGGVADHDFLQPDAANLAAFLLRLKEDFQDEYEAIVNTIKAVAPFFGDFVLKPRRSRSGDETIQLRWQERNANQVFSASTLSDGTLRFICLAAALLQPECLRPATLLIDEPELGLHPAAIVVLAELMSMVSQTTQILVSTQSVPLVNQFSPRDLLIVERKGAASTFERLEEDTLSIWLEDYGLGELWEKNLLGGRPQ